MCGTHFSPTLLATPGSRGRARKKPVCAMETREPSGTPETLWEHIAHQRSHIRRWLVYSCYKVLSPLSWLLVP